MDKIKQYIAIDLKSFYASVECVERGLDPLNTNLTVADESRTDKTICLAVSPPLKSFGVPGRPRLFEAKQIVAQANSSRLYASRAAKFRGKSVFADELNADNSLAIDFIIAPPRMSLYMDYSRRIFEIYLKFVSADDILVYSVDEVFIDVTDYLRYKKTTAHGLAIDMIRQVLKETGITATVGIGTNMYLAKIAMDIVAKRMPADKDGVRIAELDEMSYRRQLWDHRPLTDFWRIGSGISKKLERVGLYTMGDIALCSLGKENEFYNEDLLYNLFGVNAELIIDHAWGWEPTEIADCKAYTPKSRSLSSGQVLPRPYSFAQGRIVIREMADALALRLVRHGMLSDQVVLDVAYDTENLGRIQSYAGEIKSDRYGRSAPKPVHGSLNLGKHTSSSLKIMDSVCEIYDRIVDPELTVRRFNITVNNLLTQAQAEEKLKEPVQLTFFGDGGEPYNQTGEKDTAGERESIIQQTLLSIRERYGKNSIVRCLNMVPDAMEMERNRQIGGHRA